MNRTLLCILSFALLAMPATGMAQTETQADVSSAQRAQSGSTVAPKTHDIDAEYRLWGESVDRPTFESNRDSVRDSGLYQRINAAAGVEFGPMRLKLDVQALSGELTGGVHPQLIDERVDSRTRPRGSVVDSTENIVDIYEAYAAYNPGVAELRAGIQRSGFGMGLVANDGREGAWDLFNQSYGADRSIRVLLATAPGAFLSNKRVAKKIFLAVGGDLVYRDDNADLLEGDRAWQAVSSIFYEDADPNRPEHNTFLGIYFAYRNQTDREFLDSLEPDTLEVVAVDLSGRKAFSVLDDDLWIKLAAEGALLAGSSTRADSNETLEGETKLLAAGAVADAQLTWKPQDISLRLLSGYASGDANPDDDTLYRFRFDPNYKVGVVLYDHYLPATTRTAYRRIDNPERSGQAPRGIFGLVNDGAIENTFYLNPQILLGKPDGLLTGVGVLWAWSAEPLADPFNSFAQGGVPAGINGRAEASRQLGVEVDVAAQYPIRIWEHLTLETKVEYGIFFPGRAFEDELGNSGAPASVVRGRLALKW